jgi:cyclin-dependent kinase 8/11
MVDRSFRPKKNLTLSDVYELEYCVGQGTFGMVYKARERKNKENCVAIKMFRHNTKEAEGISFTAVREISLLRELNHENIVKLQEVFIETQNKCLYLVFDYAEYDLLEILKTHKSLAHRSSSLGRLPEGMIKSFMWQILNGINYLHSNWIIHRDLKPSNILVMGQGKEEGMVKIADFGLARIFQSPLRPLSDNGVVVTIWYRAPELLLNAKHYTQAIDIWAVGCIFAELHNGSPLFPGKENEAHNPKAFQENQLKTIFSILGTLTPDHWSAVRSLPDWHKIENWPRLERRLSQAVPKMNPKGFDLLQRMLEYDPSKRITAADALDHPYFKEAPFPVMNTFSYLPISPLPYPPRQDIDKSKQKKMPMSRPTG